MLNKSNKKGLDERKFRFRLAFFVLIAGTFIVYGINNFLNADIAGTIGSVLVISLLVAFFVHYVLRMRESITKGLPLDDERSRGVIEKAASTSFFVSLYLVLFASWFINSYPDVRPNLVTNLTVVVMALVFGVSYLVINSKA